MKQASLTVQLEPALLEEARKAAESEGIALDSLVNVAIAEKLSALKADSYFRARAAKADLAEAYAILDRAGRSRPAEAGDELPPR